MPLGQRWVRGRPIVAEFGSGCVDTHQGQQDESPREMPCQQIPQSRGNL